MSRLVLIVLLAALAALAPAPVVGAAAVAADEPLEALSRAQVAQILADRGYFEIERLAPQKDGSWTCTALVGPGQRVRLVVLRDGTVLERGPAKPAAPR